MRKSLIWLIVMSAGRAMTLAFVGRAGDGGPGDPPTAWLMPLVGDAFIGLAALLIVYFVTARRTPQTWVIAVVWSALGAFDAAAAWLVDLSVPWPDFFMLELFGRWMFPAAILLHVAILVLLTRPQVLAWFEVEPP